MITVSGAAGKNYRTVTVAASVMSLKTVGVPVACDPQKSVISRVEISGGTSLSNPIQSGSVFTVSGFGVGVFMSSGRVRVQNDFIPLIFGSDSVTKTMQKLEGLGVVVEIREEIA